MTAHWIDLAGVWYPELEVIDGTGTAGQRRSARERVATRPERPTALALNYESMRTDVEQLDEITWGAAIFDEAHRLKNRKALVTKAANRLTKHPRMWCWLLSGTPIPNRPEEAWSLLHLIDRHRFSSYWRWVEEYCLTEPIYRGRQVVPGARAIVGLQDGATERVRDQLSDVLFYLPLEACLPDLPSITESSVVVELSASERAIYDSLEQRFWATIADGDTGEEILLQAVNDLAKSTRLRQIVSDISILAPGKVGSKVAATVELVSDLEPEQVVVLTWSRAATEAIAGQLGCEYVHGGVTPQNRTAFLESFRRGDKRVIVGTLSVLGEGIDGLQVARHVVLHDRDWTPARNEQAIARIRRSGQVSDAVFVWHVVAADTLDQVIERALAAKVDVISALLEHRR